MFSIIAPIDSNRLEQFSITKRLYDDMDYKKEFIMPTRSYKEVSEYLKKHKLMKDVKLLEYEHERGFNPSLALNIGVKNAKYDNIIITSPEVKPKTPVLEQLSELLGQNVVCQVYDTKEGGALDMSLVNTSFRSENPGMYFLAMFNKKDIESINGWDMDFMKGYAYEDNDFGERWNRAGLPFIVRDDIQGIHQYHPRTETIPGGSAVNLMKLNENGNNGIVWCENGLNVL